jgi:hypothetical protein
MKRHEVKLLDVDGKARIHRHDNNNMTNSCENIERSHMSKFTAERHTKFTYISLKIWPN